MTETIPHVRWLVVGQFSTTPDARHFAPSVSGVNQALAEAAISVPVVVGDLIGEEDRAHYEIPLTKLRNFTQTAVSQLVLEGLYQTLDALQSGKSTVTEALERVSDVVGANGKLTTTILQLMKAPTSSTSSDLVEELLSSATSRKGALDSFIQSTKTSSTPKASKTQRTKVAFAIEDALARTAKSILDDEVLVGLEANWRGLKFLVDQCSEKTGIHVECIDAGQDQVLDIIESLRSRELDELPDAVFLLQAIGEPAKLRQLAELGEELQVPVVAQGLHSLVGADSMDDVVSKLEEPYGGTLEDWRELMTEECARWLCVLLNPVVVFNEGAASNRRVVFCSPVYAAAAMLAASYGSVAGFSRIYGKRGSLAAPAMWQLTSSKHRGQGAPTRAFFSAATQSKLAALGIMGMGSGRNTDTLSLNNAPTVRSASSALPLPSQILTGKIVRFALWARDQVPSSANDDEVSALFQQAAEVFLFHGATEGIQFKTGVEEQEGTRRIHISVEINRAEDQHGFQLAFSLPLFQ